MPFFLRNYFNPRPREGSDNGTVVTAQIGKISIHAPAKGATAPILDKPEINIISIHAPAKGAT